MAMQASPTPRYQPLYHERSARATGRRKLHLFRSEGTGLRSLCGDSQFSAAVVVGPDVARLPRCNECRLVALTEIALALDSFGLTKLAVDAAGAAHSVSYEIAAAQSDQEAPSDN